MAKFLTWIFLVSLLPLILGQSVTWYDHYTANGRQSGLVPASSAGFLLNGKPFRLVSGAIHYFRVHPAYWRDRLKKLRAAGANTVETYMPWNLHEPRKGEYDFGTGQNDMSVFLDFVTFIQMAREEDLFVVLRPGPFICAEWEFGGMPSWLLRDANMKVRSSYKGYTDIVDNYYAQIFQRIANLQFTKGDGPIIAFQIENEYGAFGFDGQPRDTQYMIHLRDLMVQLGAVEMFLTSDTPTRFQDLGSVPGVLQTANFQRGPEDEFAQLDILQPNKPYMVTEYWTGWFDHWGQGFHDQGTTVEEFADTLERILVRNSSVNFYMFHGGTSFGFMNGANVLPTFPFYSADVNTYDYDAPLTEAGDYSEKYYAAKDLIAKYNLNVPNVAMPAMPAETTKTAYPTISATQHLTLNDLVQQVPANIVIQSPNVVAMEDLPINNNNGQSYGFLLYRKAIQLADGNHQIQTIGHVRDLAVMLLDGERLTNAWVSDVQLPTFGYWPLPNRTLSFTVNGNGNTVDLLVENMGRNNFGNPNAFNQKRGLPEGPVLIDDAQVTGWTHIPLEFTSAWVKGLTNWNNSPVPSITTPTMTRATLNLATAPTDTFIQTADWGRGNRGVVFVNGFNIGRFSEIGPAHSLFIPAPLLSIGANTIQVFSLFEPVTQISFSTQPDLGPIVRP